MKCNDYMSVSACCKAELDITKNGRVKCHNCNRFCKMEDCKEEHESAEDQTEPLTFEDESMYLEPVVSENKIMVAMLGLILCIIILLWLNYRK